MNRRKERKTKRKRIEYRQTKKIRNDRETNMKERESKRDGGTEI